MEKMERTNSSYAGCFVHGLFVNCKHLKYEVLHGKMSLKLKQNSGVFQVFFKIWHILSFFRNDSTMELVHKDPAQKGYPMPTSCQRQWTPDKVVPFI